MTHRPDPAPHHQTTPGRRSGRPGILSVLPPSVALALTLGCAHPNDVGPTTDSSAESIPGSEFITPEEAKAYLALMNKEELSNLKGYREYLDLIETRLDSVDFLHKTVEEVNKMAAFYAAMADHLRSTVPKLTAHSSDPNNNLAADEQEELERLTRSIGSINGSSVDIYQGISEAITSTKSRENFHEVNTTYGSRFLAIHTALKQLENSIADLRTLVDSGVPVPREVLDRFHEDYETYANITFDRLLDTELELAHSQAMLCAINYDQARDAFVTRDEYKGYANAHRKYLYVVERCEKFLGKGQCGASVAPFSS